jgi:hypothetical protein
VDSLRARSADRGPRAAGRTRESARRALVLALIPLSIGGACADAKEAVPPADAQARSALPSGTALLVNDLPVAEPEIEAAARWTAAIEPDAVPAQHLRSALTALVLPRAVVASRRAEERAAQRARCEAAHALLLAGAPHAPKPEQRRGGFDALGFELFSAARELEPGAWSAPLEFIGRHALVRLDEREPGPVPIADRLVASCLEFHYLPPETTRAELDALIDGSRLELVQERWRELVPIAWQYRMRGKSP